MDNYQTIERKLAGLENFRGNSLTGYWSGDVYKVVSYSTVIATAVQRGHLTTFNDSKYSVTTSRHQNIVRRVFGIK